MKKLIISAGIVLIVIAYAVYQNLQGPRLTAPTNLTQSNPPVGYKDGQYTGSLTDAVYGYVKVSTVIKGGKITNVTFLQYPSDRSTSREINSQAMPYLQREAIAAQSANVNIVSGATDTSQAFQQSLNAALIQAQS